MTYTIKERRDTAGNWATINPVLAEGELGFETNTLMFKMGDGSTPWNSLAYVNVQGPPGDPGADGEPGPPGEPGADGAVGSSQIDRFTATAGQTVFTATSTPTGSLLVWRNGLLQRLTTDYTVSGSVVTLTSGASAGDAITLTYGIVAGAGTETKSPFEVLLESYVCSPLLMVDSTMSWSQPAVKTPMITGHPRPPGAFDGQYDHIHVPDDPILDASMFSVVIVFKTLAGTRQLCSRWATTLESVGCWSLDTSGTSNKTRFYVVDTAGTTTLAAATAGPHTDGAIHMAVGTFDSSKVARLYVDADTPIVSSAMSGTPKNAASAANISIGGTRETNVIENNQGDGFKGTIGAFAYLPGVVLSSAQIAALRALL